jgi:Ser/Thr protein kinase RdoA (MazF antagonist)
MGGDSLPGIAAGRELPENVGRDLWSLVESRGGGLREAACLSGTLHSQRATFRLAFTDGLVVKGRRCETEAQAERVQRLGARLDPRHFPRVLARNGAALFTEWIPGRPLTPDDLTVSRLRACGEILAGVHRGLISDEERVAGRVEADTWRRRLIDGLEALARCGALARSDQTAAAALAERFAPPPPALHLIHGDFCARNIVLDQGATLRVVDNENLTVGPAEYDLARTWYLWPMDPAERAAFADGYGLSEPLARFTAHLAFWAVLVLVESARFRLRHPTRAPAVPLGRLRSLLRRADPPGP